MCLNTDRVDRCPRALHSLEEREKRRPARFVFRRVELDIVFVEDETRARERRARPRLPQRPVYLLGTGESVETPMVSQMADFTSPRAFRVAGPKAFSEAGITHNDVDHLMIYDAFAHLPIYGLEDLGFVPHGEAAAFIAERNTAPGGKLPLNTNGGSLSYMHSGMYGRYALQESVPQMRGSAPPRSPAPRFRFATASAACSPPPAPSFSRRRRRDRRESLTAEAAAAAG
jgi:hypothetical protein